MVSAATGGPARRPSTRAAARHRPQPVARSVARTDSPSSPAGPTARAPTTTPPAGRCPAGGRRNHDAHHHPAHPGRGTRRTRPARRHDQGAVLAPPDVAAGPVPRHQRHLRRPGPPSAVDAVSAAVAAEPRRHRPHVRARTGRADRMPDRHGRPAPPRHGHRAVAGRARRGATLARAGHRRPRRDLPARRRRRHRPTTTYGNAPRCSCCGSPWTSPTPAGPTTTSSSMSCRPAPSPGCSPRTRTPTC